MQPLISDIQTTSLLYFDPDYPNLCRQFCKQRDIDYLPSLEDPKIIHQYNEATDEFVEKVICDEHIVSGHTNIFDPALLAQFRQQPLLFVHTGDYLSGVVHFSDYNSPAVSLYLYQVFFGFEKTLRELLIFHRLDNMDMVDYFMQSRAAACSEVEENRFSRKLRPFEKKKKKGQEKGEIVIPKGPLFQTFCLDDLIGLAINKGAIRLSPDVVQLRNDVMHVHDYVQLIDFEAGNDIYNLESFEAFFNRCATLHQDLKRVRNRIAYLKSAIEDVNT